MASRILVCDDELEVAHFVRDALVEIDFEVDLATDGAEALRRLRGGAHDAAVLDVMMPGLDGVEVVRELRRLGVGTPVLLLTAKSRVDHRIEGLDAGANDYLVKPFALGELLARVRVLVRDAAPAARLSCCGIELDSASRRATFRGRVVFLSSTEFSLLHFLMRNQGRTVSRKEILDHVWDDQGFRASNVVDVYVNYLRGKLDSETIRTVRGIGYRLEGPDEASS